MYALYCSGVKCIHPLANVQVSFGGLGVTVSDEQLYMTADSMMAVGLAERKGITVPEAREIISGSRSTSPANAMGIPYLMAQCCISEIRPL